MTNQFVLARSVIQATDKPPQPNPGTYGNGSKIPAPNFPATAASNSVSPDPAMNPGQDQKPSSITKRSNGGALHRGGRKMKKRG